MVCSVENCGRTVYARELCGRHYQAFRIAGTLPMSPIKRLSNEERFWHYTQRSEGYGCWEWTGPVNDTTGYGTLRLAEKRSVTAHRWGYEFLTGPVPAGLVLDHLCRNRRCVNPAHLEPVTRGENTLRGIGPSAQNARKTECHRGHPLSGENLMISTGRRYCRECNRQAARRSRERASA